MSWLEKIRSKPNRVKNNIAIISAAGLTVIVVGIWFLGLKNIDGDKEAKVNSTADDLKPLFMIFKGAKEDFKNIKETKDDFNIETEKNPDETPTVIE